MANKEATRFGFYEGLVELAKDHPEIYCLDADLAKTTGSVAFQKAFPERYIDVGIAEQNMVGISAGLSKVGLVPFCASMAVFVAGRAFEIIRNGVCYSRLNVKIVGSHGGITAAGDGGSHQCVEDIGIMRSLPNMTVLQPCDSNQARLVAKLAYEIKGPVYVRTSREPMENITSLDDKLEFGKVQILSEGKDLCITASVRPQTMLDSSHTRTRPPAFLTAATTPSLSNGLMVWMFTNDALIPLSLRISKA